MENNFRKWNKTKILFLNWLDKTELKDIFSKKLRFNNLSLWWISDLVTKDVVLNNEWYKELFKILNEKNIIKKIFINFLFLIILKNLFLP